MTMLTKIGNSQGIKIPEPIIKEANLENSEIEFEITKDGLLLKPVKKVIRKDWEDNIRSYLATKQKDEAVLNDLLDDSDLEEWKW